MPRRALNDIVDPAAANAAADGAAQAVGDEIWQTTLGRLLAAARAEYTATRGRFLDREELERESSALRATTFPSMFR
jgi:hypothetical protein